MQIFPPPRNLLHTGFKVFPQEDLQSLSAWLLHVFMLYKRQISESCFFLSPVELSSFFFFSWVLMVFDVFQLAKTWVRSSVERNGW